MTSSVEIPPIIPATQKDSDTQKEETEEVPDKHRTAYELHLIKIHASLKKLTQLARTPHVTDKEMESKIGDRGMTFDPCLSTKKRAPHRRAEHRNVPKESFFIDILGPVRPESLSPYQGPTPMEGTVMYFISFIDVVTRYA